MRIVRAREALALDAYAIEEQAPPEPGPGEVRLRVEACGVGYVDALHAVGGYQVRAALPFTPGVEVAGVVDALGPGVTGIAIGTRVLPLMSVKGGFAEQVLAPAVQLAAIPDAMSFEQAAAVRSNTLTALYALKNRAWLAEGETVLVFGAAGGVGSAAVQVAKLMGARVIAAASTEAKRDFAMRFGADGVIDTDPAGWRDRLKTVCGGHMPDVVVDPVCGPLFEAAFRSLGWNGRHLVIGFVGGEIPALKANLPLLKGAALIGVDIRQFGLNEPAEAEANRGQLRRWLADGALVPPVGEVFPFERFREALDHAGRGATGGKTILRIGRA
jgi:NADPH2:quinone reductase